VQGRVLDGKPSLRGRHLVRRNAAFHLSGLASRSVFWFGAHQTLWSVPAIPVQGARHPETAVHSNAIPPRNKPACWAKEASLSRLDPDHTIGITRTPTRRRMLYALTPVTAMCGFRPFEEIVAELTPLMPALVRTTVKNLPSGTPDCGNCSHPVHDGQEELSSLIGEYVEGLKRSSLPFATADGRFWRPKGSCFPAGILSVDPGLFCPSCSMWCTGTRRSAVPQADTLHAYVLVTAWSLRAQVTTCFGRIDPKESGRAGTVLSILEIHGRHGGAVQGIGRRRPG
jgi:mannose-6-phosphate isomerase